MGISREARGMITSAAATELHDEPHTPTELGAPAPQVVTRLPHRHLAIGVFLQERRPRP